MGVLRQFSVAIFFLLVTYLNAQDREITITGVVLDREKLNPIQGTTILNQSNTNGAVTDSVGFFTIQAYPGDTLLFSDLRYLKTNFIIPQVLEGEVYGFIQLLVNKTVILDEIQIFSFPTEDQFKETFMSLDLKPGLEERSFESKKTLESTLRKAYEDERLYYDVWANRHLYELTNEIPPNYLLDPIKWTQFIRNFKLDLNRDR